MFKVGIIDLLDRAQMDKYAIDSQKVSYSPLRPSAAGTCERSLAFKWLEYKGLLPVTVEDKTPEVLRLLDLGHSVEWNLIKNLEILQQAFNLQIKYKQHKVDVFTLFDGTIIEGSVDFCLETLDGTVKMLCDCKSKKDGFSQCFKTRYDEDQEKFAKMKSIEVISPTCYYAEDVLAFLRELGPDFMVNNIAQINLYLCSDFFQKRGYQIASLLYYNKNDSRCYEFRFKANLELHKLILDKFDNVIKSKDPLIDTTRTYPLGSIICAFCPYKNKCYSEDAKLQYFSAYPKKDWPVDIHKIANNERIVSLFDVYLKYDIKEKEKAELELTKLLDRSKVSKVRLENGRIFEVKLLKNGPVLREGKL